MDTWKGERVGGAGERRKKRRRRRNLESAVDFLRKLARAVLDGRYYIVIQMPKQALNWFPLGRWWRLLLLETLSRHGMRNQEFDPITR